MLFEPDAHTSPGATTPGRGTISCWSRSSTCEPVEVHIVTPGGRGSVRRRAASRPTPPPSWSTSTTMTATSTSCDSSGFTNPSTLLRGKVGGELDGAQAARRRSSTPTGIEVTQHFATSADGTRVPYFVVGTEARRRTAAPTLLNGYGGFENSMTPGYGGGPGPGVARARRHVRGGQHPRRRRVRPALAHAGAARGAGTGRTRTSPRSQAISSTRGITTPKQLGAQGGSNGGLLMGIMLTKYPELFGAHGVQVPLLDMRRYHLLLAGASWMAEYGDPDDPDDWAFISQVLAVPERLGGRGATRRCCSPRRPATTASIPATPARWPRRWSELGHRRASTTRTSRAATAAPPTTRRPRSRPR